MSDALPGRSSVDSPIYDPDEPPVDPHAGEPSVAPFGDERDQQVVDFLADRGLHFREALDAADRFIARFVHFEHDAQRIAVVLWIGTSYVYNSFEVAPYLHVKSPEMRSGKTLLLEVIELLCREPLRTANLSPAALFRALDKMHPTLLIDEADAIFPAKSRRNGDGSKEDLRALINSGYRRGTKTLRIGGPRRDTLEEFDAFGPKALAGIGELPDTIADRAIPIRLQRKPKTVKVERFRIRLVRDDAADIADRLAWTLEGLGDELADAWPTLPDQLSDRAQDIWEPLLAVAEHAGGPWPRRAIAAAVHLHTSGDQAGETIGVQLLADCHTEFGSDEHLWTGTLLERLHLLDEAPWSDWYGKPITARFLADRLRPYGIRSRNVRTSDGQAKGYRRSDFADAWSRYLPDPPTPSTHPPSPASPPSQPLQDKTSGQIRVTSRAVPLPSHDDGGTARDGTGTAPETGGNPDTPTVGTPGTAGTPPVRCVYCGETFQHVDLSTGAGGGCLCDETDLVRAEESLR
jgi:hypothetical protein